MSYDKPLLINIYNSATNSDINFILQDLKVKNIVFLVSLFFIFLGLAILAVLANSYGSGWSINCKISNITNENHEHLEFLTTYIMPLVFTDVNSKRTVLNLALMIIAIGAIYIKTNRFYSNPSLAILGFKVYKANIHDRAIKQCVIICRGDLIETSTIKYIQIDSNTVFAQIQ
jgi:hypothetical protein